MQDLVEVDCFGGWGNGFVWQLCDFGSISFWSVLSAKLAAIGVGEICLENALDCKYVEGRWSCICATSHPYIRGTFIMGQPGMVNLLGCKRQMHSKHDAGFQSDRLPFCRVQKVTQKIASCFGNRPTCWHTCHCIYLFRLTNWCSCIDKQVGTSVTDDGVEICRQRLPRYDVCHQYDCMITEITQAMLLVSNDPIYVRPCVPYQNQA